MLQSAAQADARSEQRLEQDRPLPAQREWHRKPAAAAVQRRPRPVPLKRAGSRTTNSSMRRGDDAGVWPPCTSRLAALAAAKQAPESFPPIAVEASTLFVSPGRYLSKKAGARPVAGHILSFPRMYTLQVEVADAAGRPRGAAITLSIEANYVAHLRKVLLHPLLSCVSCELLCISVVVELLTS